MGTLRGFPNPPAMGSGELSSPSPDAIRLAVGHAAASVRYRPLGAARRSGPAKESAKSQMAPSAAKPALRLSA